MNPIFGLPKLLTLDGDPFTTMLQAVAAPGYSCSGGCYAGCCSGCSGGSGSGAPLE
jgi:hypothetical protein